MVSVHYNSPVFENVRFMQKARVSIDHVKNLPPIASKQPTESKTHTPAGEDVGKLTSVFIDLNTY